jgi:hypothetical protein
MKGFLIAGTASGVGKTFAIYAGAVTLPRRPPHPNPSDQRLDSPL